MQSADPCSQNLLSLLMRPLRLFVKAEEMRNYRIALLKATHWPFVVLILGYERGRRFLLERRRAGSSFAAPARPPSAPCLRRPASGRFMPSTSAAAGTRRTPLDIQARAASSTTVRSAAVDSPAIETVDTLDALKALAANLRSQMDTVAALVEREKARNANKRA